jgi:hypothetical protein
MKYTILFKKELKIISSRKINLKLFLKKTILNIILMDDCIKLYQIKSNLIYKYN